MNPVRILLATVLILSFGEVLCQERVPIFKNKQDSVAYSHVTNSIQEFFKRPRAIVLIGDSTLDSLMNLQRTLRDKSVGYKDIYKSKSYFTFYEDLRLEKIEPEQVVRLSFDDMRLKTVPEDIYSCINLIEVEFVNTSIRKLPVRLKLLKKLKSVSFYNNISKERIKLSRNATIRQLTIKGTNAKVLPKTYRKLKALDTLDLSKNIDMVLFPGISSNKNIRRVVLAENNLTLRDLKKGNPSLTDLSMQRNKIETIPKAIGQFPNLKNLQLSYNSIYEIDPAIGKLKELESLALYENRLTAIPSGVFQLKNLRIVDLYFNRIDDVDTGIGSLTNLKILYLSNNFIKTLPTSLGNLKNLGRLYIHHNQLDSLPHSLGQLKQLQIVGMNNNHLKKLPVYFFDFTYLEDLDMSDNDINFLPLEWDRLPRLQLLNITGNPFKNEKDVKAMVESLKKRGVICNY